MEIQNFHFWSKIYTLVEYRLKIILNLQVSKIKILKNVAETIKSLTSYMLNINGFNFVPI